VGLKPISVANCLPSVLRRCWLGHLTCKIVPEMTYKVSSGTLSLYSLTQSSICLCLGCNIGGLSVYILAYADDVVLLAPSLCALQQLIKLMECGIAAIGMACNTRTECMVFPPPDKRKIVAASLALNSLSSVCVRVRIGGLSRSLNFIRSNMSDEKDIMREIRNLFFRTNLVVRRFAACSFGVKIALFGSFCLCCYDIA